MLIRDKGTVKCKIKLVSHASKDLNLYFFYLVKQLRKKNINFNFVRMPIKKKRLTLYKSPHVHKKAKSQYESRINTICFFLDFNSFSFLNRALDKLFINKPKSILMSITSNG